MTELFSPWRVRGAPADVVLSTLRGARVAAAVLHAPALAFLVLNSVTSKLGNFRADVSWLPLVVAVVALQGYLVWSAMSRRTPQWSGLVWLAITACVTTLIAGVGLGNVAAMWFVAAAGAFAFPGRLGLVVLVLTVVAFVIVASTGRPECLCWSFTDGVTLAPPGAVFYNAVAGVTGAVGPFMAARLLSVVDDLARTRAQLELTVTDEERRRLSRDLHDALGQGLSAVALKCDLVTALLDKNPRAAQEELDSLIEVAQRVRVELPDILGADHAASFDAESRRAERLLREAGVQVRRHGDVGVVPEEVDSALGWVVREAATNVLRHSDAGTWTVNAGRGAGTVWLEATNDRPRRETGPAGSGLLGMTERLRAVGGRVRTHADGQHFTLRVEVAS